MQEDGDDNDCKRIPCDVLETGEAESVFKNHANNLQLEQNRQEYVTLIMSTLTMVLIVFY